MRWIGGWWMWPRELLAAGRRRRITVAGACADEVFEALVLGALLVDHVGAQAELFVRH